MLVSDELIGMVQDKANYTLTIAEIEAAYIPAKRKLDDLINRFGTDNGKRLCPKYLAQLIFEEINTSRFAIMCKLKYEQKKEEQFA